MKLYSRVLTPGCPRVCTSIWKILYFKCPQNNLIDLPINTDFTHEIFHLRSSFQKQLYQLTEWHWKHRQNPIKNEAYDRSHAFPYCFINWKMEQQQLIQFLIPSLLRYYCNIPFREIIQNLKCQSRNWYLCSTELFLPVPCVFVTT